MRSGIALVLSLLFIATASGEPRYRSREELYAAIAAQRRHASASTRSAGHGSLKTDAVSLETAQNQFVIPASGNLGGAGGTYFRSDVTLINYNDTAQKVVAAWLPAGQDNTNASTITLTLEGLSFYTFVDFVGTKMGKSGLGALYFRAIDSSGKLDENAFVDGFSRIWTPQPGVSGSVSQSFEAVTVDHCVGDYYAAIIGLRTDSGFRTNVGIVNLYSRALSWDVYVYGTKKEASFSITVPAYGLIHTGLPAGDYGPLVVFVVPNFDDTAAAEALWTSYGTSNDNVTGDGWVARASQ